MNCYFVTGTDTGVGKTQVSASLLNYVYEQGHTSLGLKPIASGAHKTDAGYQNDDALSLIQASSETYEYHQVNPYVFEPAIAPHLAADRVGHMLSVSDLSAWYKNLNPKADLVLLEGAGGWKCPLNKKETLADFVCSENLPVILVVGMRLGCLNHAILTAESIVASGGKLHSWVANILEPDMPVLLENIETLEAFMPSPLLAIKPFSERVFEPFKMGHRLDSLVG